MVIAFKGMAMVALLCAVIGLTLIGGVFAVLMWEYLWG